MTNLLMCVSLLFYFSGCWKLGISIFRLKANWKMVLFAALFQLSMNLFVRFDLQWLTSVLMLSVFLLFAFFLLKLDFISSFIFANITMVVPDSIENFLYAVVYHYQDSNIHDIITGLIVGTITFLLSIIFHKLRFGFSFMSTKRSTGHNYKPRYPVIFLFCICGLIINSSASVTLFIHNAFLPYVLGFQLVIIFVLLHFSYSLEIKDTNK